MFNNLLYGTFALHLVVFSLKFMRQFYTMINTFLFQINQHLIYIWILPGSWFLERGSIFAIKNELHYWTQLSGLYTNVTDWPFWLSGRINIYTFFYILTLYIFFNLVILFYTTENMKVFGSRIGWSLLAASVGSQTIRPG